MKRQGLDRGRFWRLGFTVLVVALATACSSGAGHSGSAAAPTASRPATAAGRGLSTGQPDRRWRVGRARRQPGHAGRQSQDGTVYVPIQCTTSFCSPNTPGHVVDVIDAATCNANAEIRLPGGGHGPGRQRPARRGRG